jgi:hypothetical protein
MRQAFAGSAGLLTVLLGLFLLSACVPATPPPAPTPASDFERAFGPCGEPCLVGSNGGGELAYFLRAADEVNAGSRELIVIDGACQSACAAFADKARAHVCITPAARFGFHKATVYSADLSKRLGAVDPPQSADIQAWVAANGGYPPDGMRMMDATEAARFWRPCTDAERGASGAGA